MHHMHDLRGNRCVVCDYCRQIKSTDDCVCYCGKGTKISEYAEVVQSRKDG